MLPKNQVNLIRSRLQAFVAQVHFESIPVHRVEDGAAVVPIRHKVNATVGWMINMFAAHIGIATDTVTLKLGEKFFEAVINVRRVLLDNVFDDLAYPHVRRLFIVPDLREKVVDFWGRMFLQDKQTGADFHLVRVAVLFIVIGKPPLRNFFANLLGRVSHAEFFHFGT